DAGHPLNEYAHDLDRKRFGELVNQISGAEKGSSSDSLIVSTFFNLKDSVFTGYSPNIDTDLVLPYLFLTQGYGFAAVQLMLSDYLGENRIVFTSDYFRYEDNNDVNFDIAYYYLKYRWDFGLGIFRQKNPIGLFSLSTINELIHNIYWDTLYMNRYGAYGIASYPFSRFFRIDFQATSAREEIDYISDSERRDIFTNQNSLGSSLVYDNTLPGFFSPVDGFRGAFNFEQSMEVTGKDAVFSSVGLDLRRYFLINKKYVFALMGRVGKILGRDSDLYRYYIGGFYTLRGHPLFEYSGRNMFLCNTEFRFIFIEGIKFGWPLFFQIGGIGGALFADFGSAWDSNYDFIDNNCGKFNDFKADTGFGFRFTLYPVIIFKLDFAWPYYYNSFGKKEVLFSLGFEY
ncbi:MAG: BamA/TamA family outer membrane protein, partial [Spirochaetes bacterium]|nr:BamA/TamA family outer membrane protein [Spirochaetota bacterium]